MKTQLWVSQPSLPPGQALALSRTDLQRKLLSAKLGMSSWACG